MFLFSPAATESGAPKRMCTVFCGETGPKSFSRLPSPQASVLRATGTAGAAQRPASFTPRVLNCRGSKPLARVV